MKSSSRIAINTAATYTRSLLSVGLVLFSSRWILRALGATDFGLFQVVGSLIVFLTFFNSVMASSAARHFAFSIGKGDTDDVNRWFNSSLAIHLILPSVLIVIGWPIAEYAIRHWLTIPPERIAACVIVFRTSLIGAFLNMVSIPFIAMFNAKQKIAEISMWSMLQTILVFGIAWTLTKVSSDRLIFYAISMVGTYCLVNSIKVIRAITLFPECRIHIQTGFDFKRMKELFHFASWSFLGNASSTLQNQGSGILLNLYFGPSLNAAFGIARQVSTQTNQLSAAMLTAFMPEITAREGRGEHSRALSLSHFASKVGCIMVMLFSIPLIFEMNYVLKLWLVTPPAHTTVFCQLILCTVLIDRLTSGYMLAVSAKGKIAGYQATIGGLLLLSIPLAWGMFALGFAPSSLVLSFMITISFASVGRVLWLKRLFHEPINHWLKMVLLPCSIVAASSVVAILPPRLLLDESFLRLVLSTAASMLAMSLTSWFVALTVTEKSFLMKSVSKIINRINSRKHLAPTASPTEHEKGE